MKFNPNSVKKLMQKGFDGAYSVVKSYRGSIYLHYVSFEELITNNYNWIPAPKYNGRWHGRVGQTRRQIGMDKTIIHRKQVNKFQ